MKMKKEKPYYPKVRIGPNGGVRLLDVDTYFKQPKILKQIERAREMDLTGKKLGVRIAGSSDDSAPGPDA